MDFKGKIVFACQIKPIVSEDKDKYLSVASIEQLRNFIPNIDLKKNIDLLPIATNAAVVNRTNKNDDAITTDIALAIVDSFVHKPIDIEHNRSKICGVIVSAGFSEFGTDKPLTKDEVKGMTKPFNIVLGGLIWRIVSSDLANLVEETNDPNSTNYLKISASWELGFYEFEIAQIEGSSKNLEDATYTKDEKQVGELEKCLKAYGGTGKGPDGKRIYRVPVGDVKALGIGLTESPAADVKGVATPPTQEPAVIPVTEEANKEKPLSDVPNVTHEKPAEIPLDEKASAVSKYGEERQKKNEANTAKTKTENDKLLEQQNRTFPKEDKLKQEKEKYDSAVIIGNAENSISQVNKNNVKKDSPTMKITDVKDITDESLKTITASELTQFISSELQKANDTYVKDKNALTEALNSAKAEYSTLKDENSTNKTKLQELQTKIEALETQSKANEAKEKFDNRMSLLNDEYELDADLSKVIAKKLPTMTDEVFAAYQEELAVMLAAKKKKKMPPFKPGEKPGDKKNDKEPDNDDDDKGTKGKKGKEAKASAELEDAINKGTPNTPDVPNTPPSTPDEKEKWGTAFAEDQWEIKKSRRQ